MAILKPDNPEIQIYTIKTDDDNQLEDSLQNPTIHTETVMSFSDHSIENRPKVVQALESQIKDTKRQIF